MENTNCTDTKTVEAAYFSRWAENNPFIARFEMDAIFTNTNEDLKSPSCIATLVKKIELTIQIDYFRTNATGYNRIGFELPKMNGVIRQCKPDGRRKVWVNGMSSVIEVQTVLNYNCGWIQNMSRIKVLGTSSNHWITFIKIPCDSIKVRFRSERNSNLIMTTLILPSKEHVEIAVI
jgi:hypothetical protein